MAKVVHRLWDDQPNGVLIRYPFGNTFYYRHLGTVPGVLTFPTFKVRSNEELGGRPTNWQAFSTLAFTSMAFSIRSTLSITETRHFLG